MLPSYIRVRAVVWAYGRGQSDRQTDTQTDTQTRVTTIHFASSTTHAKCNNMSLSFILNEPREPSQWLSYDDRTISVVTET